MPTSDLDRQTISIETMPHVCKSSLTSLKIQNKVKFAKIHFLTLLGGNILEMSNFFDKLVGCTKDCLFFANMRLDNNTASLIKKIYVPNIVQIAYVNQNSSIIFRMDAGSHFILAYMNISYTTNIQIIDKIPKMDETGVPCDSEKFIVNAKCTMMLYHRARESNPQETEMMIASLEPSSMLQKYSLEQFRPISQTKNFYFAFTLGQNLMEFDKSTKTGQIHKINLFMIVESTLLKTPSSWHTSNFAMMESVSGESTSLILMEEDGKKFLVMCDVRLNGDSYWFTALHNTEYLGTDNIVRIKIRRMTTNFQYLACIQTGTHLEMVNYYMKNHMVNDQRLAFQLPGNIYNIIFVKGYYFFVFKDGSISHINHVYFFSFQPK